MDLLAELGAISYDDGVTNAELWSAVGAELRRLRTERGYSSTIALATALGQDTLQKTFDRIERGEVGQVKSVHRYCEALETTLALVLRRVLPAETFSGRAAQVASAYDRQPAVQPLVDLALQLPARAEVHDRPQGGQAGDLHSTSGASRGRGRTVRVRR